MNATVEKTNANGNGCADVKENGDGNGNETTKPAAISSDVSLPNDVLEHLFQRYSIKQRRAGLECFLATSILFDLWVIFVALQDKSSENIGMYAQVIMSILIFGCGEVVSYMPQAQNIFARKMRSEAKK